MKTKKKLSKRVDELVLALNLVEMFEEIEIQWKSQQIRRSNQQNRRKPIRNQGKYSCDT